MEGGGDCMQRRCTQKAVEVHQVVDIRLYTCRPMNARISIRQCEINRHGISHAPGRVRRPPCLSCIGCPGLDLHPVPVAAATSARAAFPATAPQMPALRNADPPQQLDRQPARCPEMPPELLQRIVRRTAYLLRKKGIARFSDESRGCSTICYCSDG